VVALALAPAVRVPNVQPGDEILDAIIVFFSWIGILEIADTFFGPVGRPIPIRTEIKTVLDVWAAVLPARIANEDLADYIEDISRRVVAGQRKLVWLRVAAAIFWTGINAVGFALLNVYTRRRV
jgi:hypothetical protein